MSKLATIELATKLTFFTTNFVLEVSCLNNFARNVFWRPLLATRKWTNFGTTSYNKIIPTRKDS